MSTYSQEPAVVHLAFVRGDEFGATVDFSNDLSGYSLSASVFSLVSQQNMAPLSVSVVSQTAGIVTVSLTELQTSLMPAGTYGWNMYWDAPGSVRRSALSGTVEVRNR